jgi:hypothetical protein
VTFDADEGNHQLVLLDSKINYIHVNPVSARIVEKEEVYMYSSFEDYYGKRKGLLELAELSRRIINLFYL